MIKEPTIFLTHILESINLLEKYLEGVTEDEFHASTEKQDLAVRRIEIIGEAAKNIPDAFKSQYPDIPWKKMAGMRDVLIHQYFGINMNRVWETATQFTPPLKAQIQKILQNYTSDK